MKKSDLLLAIGKLEKALLRLKDATEQAEDELEKDGTIQRFEFTVELLWKTFKIVLQYNGIDCSSPRNCVKEAFKSGFLEDDEVVLDMLEDRNKSSHIYDEQVSEEIFQRVKNVYVNYVERAVKLLREKI